MEIISPAWAIGLTVAFIGILGAFQVQRHFAFRTYSVNFRSNFDSAYSINIFNSHTIDLFKTEFLRHRKAAVEFRNHLNWFSKRRFDRALQNYEQWGNKILSESAHTGEGVYKLTLAHEGRNISNEFKIHIDLLLSYAK